MEMYIWESGVFAMFFPDMIILEKPWEYAGHAQTDTAFQNEYSTYESLLGHVAKKGVTLHWLLQPTFTGAPMMVYLCISQDQQPLNRVSCLDN